MGLQPQGTLRSSGSVLSTPALLQQRGHVGGPPRVFLPASRGGAEESLPSSSVIRRVPGCPLQSFSPERVSDYQDSSPLHCQPTCSWGTSDLSPRGLVPLPLYDTAFPSHPCPGHPSAWVTLLQHLGGFGSLRPLRLSPDTASTRHFLMPPRRADSLSSLLLYLSSWRVLIECGPSTKGPGVLHYL